MNNEEKILAGSAPSISSNHPGNKADPSPEDEVAETENGDAYCEDTGTYLGTITDFGHENLGGLPVNISIFFEGFWYIYKMDSKYPEEKSTDSTNEKGG